MDLKRLVKALTVAAAFLAISVPGGASAQSTADLAVSVVGSPDPVRANAAITWTITVTNLGPEQASDVLLKALYGSDAFPVSATTTQGTCGGQGFPFTFSLGSIPPGGQVTATFVLQTFRPDGDRLFVSASSATEDPNMKNNRASGSVGGAGRSPRRELSGTFCPPIGGVATGGGGTAPGSQDPLTTVIPAVGLLAAGLLAAAATLVRRVKP